LNKNKDLSTDLRKKNDEKTSTNKQEPKLKPFNKVNKDDSLSFVSSIHTVDYEPVGQPTTIGVGSALKSSENNNITSNIKRKQTR
jgi:hypothetical protein